MQATSLATAPNSAASTRNSRKRKAPDAALGQHAAVADADSEDAPASTDGEASTPSPPFPPPPLRPPPLFSTRPRLDYVSHPPDFADLARLYPFFAPFVQHGGGNARRARVDFRDPRCLFALTRVLLLHDFQLRFELPAQNLCPPIPQRLAVLYWVDDLLREQQQQQQQQHARRGVDVGCGASAIFPLLGVRAFGWQFVATEVDSAAAAAARHNVELNSMQHEVEVREVTDRRQVLLGVLGAADGHFDFVVCNPPFFSHSAQAQLSPHRTSAATQSELVCEGGELTFVRQLYADSAQLRRQLGWVVAMIGKKDTLRVLRAEMAAAAQQQAGSVRRSAPCQVRTTTFEQGKQTRWGLAWTFNALLPLPSATGSA